MTPSELSTFVEAFQAEQRKIMSDKGTSYSGAKDASQGDRLANFKRVADRVGVSPMQVWLIYFLKHVDSVCTFVKTGHESEGLRSRALDIANYAMLGVALNDEAAGLKHFTVKTIAERPNMELGF
jgi:hypothetical protein